MQEKVFNIIFNEDDITWKSMILELVKKEEMDPWDIDITKLSKRFIEMVSKLKEMDFKISGKIILAAAILLRIKSNRLVKEDIDNLNRLIAMTEEDNFYDDFYEEGYNTYSTPISKDEIPAIVPRTPQPRKRKVSVYDLVEALQQALEVKKRRMSRIRDKNLKIEIPDKKVDMEGLIMSLYEKIMNYFKKEKRLTFSQIVPSDNKEDKVYTFIPLLHLDKQRKIDLFQEKHLGEIGIALKQ